MCWHRLCLNNNRLYSMSIDYYYEIAMWTLSSKQIGSLMACTWKFTFELILNIWQGTHPLRHYVRKLLYYRKSHIFASNVEWMLKIIVIPHIQTASISLFKFQNMRKLKYIQNFRFSISTYRLKVLHKRRARKQN